MRDQRQRALFSEAARQGGRKESSLFSELLKLVADLEVKSLRRNILYLHMCNTCCSYNYIYGKQCFLQCRKSQLVSLPAQSTEQGM